MERYAEKRSRKSEREHHSREIERGSEPGILFLRLLHDNGASHSHPAQLFGRSAVHTHHPLVVVLRHSVNALRARGSSVRGCPLRPRNLITSCPPWSLTRLADGWLPAPPPPDSLSNSEGRSRLPDPEGGPHKRSLSRQAPDRSNLADLTPVLLSFDSRELLYAARTWRSSFPGVAPVQRCPSKVISPFTIVKM